MVWPATPCGETRVISCFDDADNGMLTRTCGADGRWGDYIQGNCTCAETLEFDTTWPATSGGETAHVKCANSDVQTRDRLCLMNGEWDDAMTGGCWCVAGEFKNIQWEETEGGREAEHVCDYGAVGESYHRFCGVDGGWSAVVTGSCRCPETEALDVQIILKDKDAAYVVVICMKEEALAVEDALRTGGFARPSQTVDEIPAVKKEQLEAQIEELNQHMEAISEKIKACEDSREELKMVGDYFRMRTKKYEVLGTLPQSERTFVLSGYVPAKASAAVEKAIGEKFDCVVDVEDLKEDEEPPVLLKNNAFASSVEGVLEAYGMPCKGEVDPTAIMSFFYVFFFGMMLSDAAYGAIVAIACFIVLKKFPRMDKGMHKTIKLFMFCGVSTIVWGVLFGGYFGDVVDVVTRTFFGEQITVPALWFAPLNDPMKLLVYSMLFGLIHLFVGLGIKGYMLIRDGKILDFFCDVVLWYLFLIGLIMMLLPSDLFASIAQMEIVFPPVLNTVSKGLAIAGAVGILLMSGRDNKNPVLRIALGAYDLYNITGWLSDVLSYSRLLALGLATGVIASVVNQMGSMLGKSIAGAILFIVVFVIGHAMNMAINLLGAYVHTNRLQTVFSM